MLLSSTVWFTMAMLCLARYSLYYLLYWYKSTTTDAARSRRYSVYLLYWYKSTNTDR